MKRLLCAILAAVLICAAMPSITTKTSGETACSFFEDFEANVEQWQIYDGDGDGKNWTLKDDAGYSYSGSRFVVSQSYINTDDGSNGALSPDNWLISPAFTPKDGDCLNWMIAAMDVNYQKDEYEVYVLHEGYAEVTEGAKIYSGYANGENRMTPWAHISVDLKEYAGESIHVAFRHHCEGQYWLMLDFVYVADKDTTPDIACPIEYVNVLNNYETDPDVIRIGECWVTEVYVKPIGASTKFVRYSSSNPDVASVDENGYVTGLSEGDAVITAYTPNGLSDSYNIRVQGESFYFEDFEYGKLHGDGGKGWKYRDADGDGYKWRIEDFPAEEYGYRCIFSSSAEPLNPDNWVISAEFTVPTGTSSEISWFDDIYGGADCRLSEHYIVYIAINPSSADDFTTKLFEGDTDGNYLRTADISAYAGKTVRLAFRHCNSKGGSGLLIDRISAYKTDGTPTPPPTQTPTPTPTPTSEPTPTPTTEPTPTPTTEPSPTVEPTTPVHVMLGDVNADEKVNTADAVMVLKDSAGMITLDEKQQNAADVNRDSKVNTADAVQILKFAAGMITEF